MIRLNLRLKHFFILAWLLCLWAMLAITPSSYVSYYPELSDRTQLLSELQNNLGTQAMYGVLNAPGNIGQLTNWKTGAWLAILSAVMSVLLLSSLHRTAEAKGTGELIQSTGHQRSAVLKAALLTGGVVAAINGAVSTAILIILRLTLTTELTIAGSITYGLSIFLTMLGIMALASIVQSLWGTAHNLNRLGLLVIAGAFLVRVFADTSSQAWAHYLNWISPLGWRSVIDCFGTDNWGSILVFAIASLAWAAIALWLNSRREFNSHLLHLRRAHHAHQRRIGGLHSLNLVMHRTGIITWAVVVGAMLLTFLPLIDSLIPLLQEDEATRQALQSFIPMADFQKAFITYAFQLCAILVAIACVAPIVAYIAEEHRGIVDLIRSAGTARYAPLEGAVVISFSTLACCTFFAIAGGLVALQIQTSTVEEGNRIILESTLNLFLQSLLFIGLAVLIAGVAPRLIQLAWAPIAIAAVVSIFGQVLGLPQEVINLSPFSQTDSASLLMFAAIGVLAVGGGLWGSSLREVYK
ncbi:ABC transporter permease [Corynebacterium callunae]|uniref:ABC transporter permease n=1 Tax=Corynebacterium callunae TaxID=1721 RepID=UPI003981D7E9